MAETLKRYLDQAGLEALVGKIKSEDDAHLAEAKAYAEGLGVLYDPVNSASGAEQRAKAYTDEKVAPLATTEALNAVDGKVATETSERKAADEALQTAINGVDAKAVKNAEDIAALAGTHATDKAALEAKDAELAGAIEDLADFVGELPEGTDATTVVAYIDAKTANIASDETVSAIADRVTEAEKAIDAIEADYLKAADKEELAGDIEEVQGNVDTLAGIVADNKSELEGKIALKADQTALEAVSGVANAAVKQSDYDVKVKALEDEDIRIAGLVEAEAAKAREEEGKLDARLDEVEAFFKLAEGESLDAALDTLVEIQTFINGEGAAADQMVLDIAANKKAIEDHVATNHDFAGADAALKAELEGKINGKVAQGDFDAVEGRVDVAEGKIEVVEGKVSTLEGKMTAVEGAVATKAEAQDLTDAVATLTEADEALAGRLDDVEAMLGDGDNSVSDMIAEAEQRAKDAAAEDAANKDVVVLTEAQGYADGLNAAMDERVAELETASATHALASDLATVSGKVGTLETDMAQAKADIDAVELLAAANKAAHEANAAAIALKASQADLDTLADRVTTVEGAVATKAEQEALNAAVVRIAKNEENIAANTSAIGKFQPIATTDIEGLFA